MAEVWINGLSVFENHGCANISWQGCRFSALSKLNLRFRSVQVGGLVVELKDSFLHDSEWSRGWMVRVVPQTSPVETVDDITPRHVCFSLIGSYRVDL